jgi:hypothetical protein
VDESPHAVLDANLVVRGLLTPYGGSGRVLRALAESLFMLVTSESILYEVATCSTASTLSFLRAREPNSPHGWRLVLGPGVACYAGMRLSMPSILLVFTFVVGCGSTSLGTDGGGGGAAGGLGGRAGGPAGQGGQTDGGELACGDARCQSSQICLYPPYGCIIAVSPDAGVCPAGSEYSDAAAGCLDVPLAPSCVSLTPGQGSFDCSGADAGATCGTVNAPIPRGCSHVCRSICI